MALDSLKKLQLESQLSVLDRNFFERDASPPLGKWTRTFSPPALADVVAEDQQNARVKQEITAMLLSDNSIKKLYAGILLSAVDRALATKILTGLINDSTPVIVQKSVGFGLVSCSVKILARDFLARETIRGDNYFKVETLANWATAISLEKKSKNQIFDENVLPKWDDVLTAQENPTQLARLQSEIERLKNDASVAAKFYAAVLLEQIDQSESRKLLESLSGEKTTVALPSGDQINNVPAQQLAASLLNPQSSDVAPSKIENPIARVFKWLSNAVAAPGK